MKKSVTIIGYGFISKYFLKEYQNQFQSIITTTRSSNHTKFATQSFKYDLYENQKITFPNTNYCIITIPFSRSLTDPFDYPKSQKNLIHQLPIQHYERILFTSSTSIYKPNNSLITETDELDTTKRALALSTEQTILTASNKSIVLRLQQVFVVIPEMSMLKLTSPTIDDSNLPVNLIHVDDIIKVMSNLNH